ncbi:MAG: sulfatase-like hydrolase/transferase, partial [Planctomycetota bacterium]
RFHRTPNLDRLGSRGLRLTQAYSASALCSPTRASILTGLHPARIGITSPACHPPTVQLEKRLKPNPGPGVEVINADSLTRLQPLPHPRRTPATGRLPHGPLR